MNRSVGAALAAVAVLAVIQAAQAPMPAHAAPPATLVATYQAAPPQTAGAGTTIQVPVTVTNLGTDTWSGAGPNPVNLAYHWTDTAAKTVVWEGSRTALGADVPVGASRPVTASITLPALPGTYLLQLALVQEGVAWLNPSVSYGVSATPAFNALFGAVTMPPLLLNGTTYTVNVPVTNRGTAIWGATGQNLVDLSYHWTDASGNIVVWDGARTPLATDVAVGATATVAAKLATPADPGTYALTFDLVREGVAWFGSLGGAPLQLTAGVMPATYAALYSISATSTVLLGESRTIAGTVTNNGNVSWTSGGANPVNLAYHLFDANGKTVLWDGARTSLGADLLPGQSRPVTLAYTAPTSIGTYALAVDAVREGVAWFSSIGSPAARTPLVVTSGFNGGYDQTTTPALATIGATVQLSVRVTNYGARAWPSGGTNPVHLSYHLTAASGGSIVWDGNRGVLASDVAVGQSATVPIIVELPGSVGNYAITWDLVQEGVAWFSALGIAPLRETFSVQPGVTFYGKGFGHGVGMSQYGAQGWATGSSGTTLTGEQIVARYYPGTQLTLVDSATNARGPMRVLLSAPSSSGSATCGQAYMDTWLNNVRSGGGFRVLNEAAGNAVVGSAGANVTFQIVARGGGVAVYDQSANPPALRYEGPGPVTLVPSDLTQPITIQEKGEFVRGKVQYKNTGFNTLRVVNFVGYDEYVQGVIPKEMPLGWHIEAYKAQALAARTYGFTSAASTREYDVRDDQSDQCYGGATVETTAGNQAAVATAGKVITYNGVAIRAYFASSSGGYTLGVGCWNHGTTCGPSDPWLAPVADPADLTVNIPYANKHANWQVTYTSDQIRSILINYRGVDIGTLVSVDVSNQAPVGLGHVISIKFRGSANSVEVPADGFLRGYLGLKSTMVRLSPF
ncbi:MAG TPA: SpoIID/LytB domain-containing protein [Candidatus Limnocylindria bacterium]|nr:SpoIID/LytB domain-containing protein [Candidatus Limnocylindria bacterium]